MIKFIYLNADAEYHWDSKNYYASYLSVYFSGNYNSAYSYFGKSTEFLFPTVYMILSVFPKVNNAEILILLHTMMFALLYVVLLTIMVHKRHINLSGAILLLGLCPPGIAAQLAHGDRISYYYFYTTLYVQVLVLFHCGYDDCGHDTSNVNCWCIILHAVYSPY